MDALTNGTKYEVAVTESRDALRKGHIYIKRPLSFSAAMGIWQTSSLCWCWPRESGSGRHVGAFCYSRTKRRVEDYMIIQTVREGL